MGLPASIQTLSAAFSYGILLQAATGALFIYYKANDAKILQDGRRLVLMLFMLFAALWAQLSFIDLIVTSTSTSMCQALLVFTTIFDQLARISIEQFFLWAMSQGTKSTTQQYLLQGVLVVRLIAGGVLVGLTRPDAPKFSPVCAAHTSVLPVAIVVLALDFVIIGASIIRIFSMGILNDMRVAGKSSLREQSKALIFGVLAYAMWAGASVPMILGVSTLPLIVRTVVPSNGLLILVGVLTIFPAALLSKREDEGTTPEAQSPFTAAPAPPTREIFRENVDNDSEIFGANSTKGGFFATSKATDGLSPAPRFSGFSSSNEPIRGFTKLDSGVTVREIGGKDTQLSVSQAGPGYKGSSGVFPTNFAAPLLAGSQSGMAVRTGEVSKTTNTSKPPQVGFQKRNMFWSKSPAKTSIRNLSISNPVVNEVDQNTTQPFEKIPTIDLATAAANERERRKEAAVRSRLTEIRVAMGPQALRSNGFQNSISLKRKETSEIMNQPLPTIPGSNTHSLSVAADSASTTSTSLSPGHEEVRRRSPRNSKSFERSIDKPAPKPPLQRKGTIGLPSNPKAGGQRITMGREVANEPTIMLVNEIVYNDPTMVNSIMSAAPHTFTDTKRPKTSGNRLESMPSAPPKSSNSILHRPRPYRRDSETDRALFPSEAPLHHQRSKSGPSMLMIRKSMLSSPLGSPTDLPPLPPPPTSAMKLRRLLPNETKSMTFDEKIELLFPAPPGVSTIPNRRSSVPSLPRASAQMDATDALAPKSPVNPRDSQMHSKRSTIASFAFLDFNDGSNSPKQAPQIPAKAPARTTYRFSANTYRNLADEVGETWIPGIPTGNVNARNSVRVPTTKIYDGRKSAWTEATSSDESSPRDTRDSVTYWGSVHSEAPAVDLSKARQNARSTFIQPNLRDEQRNLPPVPPLEYNDKEEIMTVMFDISEARQPILTVPVVNNSSSVVGFEHPLSQAHSNEQTINRWHRQIGDELPAFSRGSSNARVRRMPPPTPLLLNKRGRAATVVVHAREPSPVDSPERALQAIQAQLRKFEEPIRGSVDSILRRIPANGLENDIDVSRLRLLENLEKEMGQQEDQWQQMHTNFDQDSVSAMSPATTVVSEESFSRRSSIRLSRSSSLDSVKRERRRMSMRSKKQESTPIKGTQCSGTSIWQRRLAEAQGEYMAKASALLRKGSVNFLSVAKSHQLGSPTPPESVDSGTDVSSDSESESEGKSSEHSLWIASMNQQIFPSLWQPAIHSPRAASGRMWNPPYQTTSRVELSEPPAQNIRPSPRSNCASLKIFSTSLWVKPRTPDHKRTVTGLWGSKAVRPRSIITRKVTQRPQRKSKRLTFLPDIVESPVPLPNKRDTLGIYQFPWGEKSDTAVYQPAFNPVILQSSLINARLQGRSQQLEPDLDEYSASYFDDYDGEEDDSSDMGTESDDDFDETTLWEIASLLKTSDVPSTDSLLPQARRTDWSDDFTDQYDQNSDFDDDFLERYGEVAKRPVMQLPIQPLTTTRPCSLLWTKGDALKTKPSRNGLPQPAKATWTLLISMGDHERSKARYIESLPMLQSSRLWKPEPVPSQISTASLMWTRQTIYKTAITDTLSNSKLWERVPIEESFKNSGLFVARETLDVIRNTPAMPVAVDMVKARRVPSESLPALSSSSMWLAKITTSKPKVWNLVSNKNMESRSIPSKMWAPAKKEVAVASAGLFHFSGSMKVCRTTTKTPAALLVAYKSRTNHSPLAKLTSNKLWDGCQYTESERDWISESSVRPESPFISSVTSSGQSSPISDSSSIKSTSTKASSIWGSFTSSIPWSLKSAKKPTPRSPVAVPETSPKYPAQQFTKRGPSPVAELTKTTKIPSSVNKLASVRESRVLSFRDLFEERHLALDTTSGNKLQKDTKLAAPPTKLSSRRHEVVQSWEDALAEAILARKPKMTRSPRVATSADWAAALSVAISASKLRLNRIHATPAMWKAALDKAVTTGNVEVLADFDSSVRHPVFFVKNMTSTSADIHPAAIGHFTIIEKHVATSVAKSSPRFDSSVRHPVFFANNMTSTSAEIHPAAIGYCTIIESVVLWTPTIVTKTQRSDKLWSKVHVTKKVKPSMFTAVKTNSVGVARVFESIQVAELKSSTCWKAPKSSAPERNWLIESSKVAPKSLTWKPVVTPMITEKQSSFLWSKSISLINNTEAFVVDASLPLKKLASPISSGLPPLTSNSLWQSSRGPAAAGKNWLLSNRKENDILWTAPKSFPDEDDSHMWSAKRVFDRNAPMQPLDLGNQKSKKPASTTDVALALLESSALWQPLEAKSSQRNWFAIKHTSGAVKSLTWTLRPQSSSPNSTAMWSKTASEHSAQEKDIFGHVIHDRVKKASILHQPQLTSLQSTQLFQRIRTVTQEKNWLLSTCNGKLTPSSSVHLGASVDTWPTVAPVVSVSQTGLMWEKHALAVSSSPTLFANPHTGSSIRAKRDLEPIKTIESFEMWRRSTKTPTSPRNWLINKAINKVEFRY